MRIATLQYNIVWENTTANLERLEGLLSDLNADVLVLPEMFNTGFSMTPKDVALEKGGVVLEWMKIFASKKSCAIVGSVPVQDSGRYYNRLFWVEPSGLVLYYDKRHLFRMAGEHEQYTPGDRQVVVSFKGMRFMLQVCYDLRFPVWSRNTDDEELYDCLIYVANWPEVRSDAWFSLLKARAIENLSYVIGVNRVGEDGNGIAYDGKSAVFDFKGGRIDTHQDTMEGISYQELDVDKLIEFREKFPAFLDADDFEIKN